MVLRWCRIFAVISASHLPLTTAVQAQPPRAAGETAAASAGKPAVIERVALTLRAPELMAAPLHLDPVRSVEIAARADGAVGSIGVKVGDVIQAQSEVARLDTQERQLELTRAQAAFKAAQEEQNAADSTLAAAAAARTDVAKADLDLAKLRLDQCNIRTPLSGQVTAVHVVEGEVVRAGQALVTVIDPSQLRVELPVDGKTVTAGGSIELKVEDTTVPAKVQAVIPLAERFEPLRDLFLSVASAVAVIENPGGKFRAGQTVYSPMIPRLPVTEIPNSALSNASDGERKVQVIREGFVRDIPVQLLGQVGEDHVFVSGRFAATDELIVKSSERLLDGARVVSQAQPAGTPAAVKPSQPAASSKTGGF